MPVIVNVAGGAPRLIEAGEMPSTRRVSVTVSATVVTRLNELLDVCCHTWTWTDPADSPGMFGVIAVDCVGNGTVRVVPPVRAVARACASKVLPRMKLMA